MIGRIQGALISKEPPMLLVDVQGVGYEIEVPLSTLFDLPATGQPVTLLIHTVVREDAFLLYGFGRETDRRLFRHLLKVTGVGAKLALAVLSGMTAEEFTRAIVRNDLAALVRLPGIGRKTAERLVIELRDRIGAGNFTAEPTVGGTVSPQPSASNEAMIALEALGYKPAEALKMVKAVPIDEQMTVEQIIRQALRPKAGG
jgi:Holliday junction DNA helicase RuvA